MPSPVEIVVLLLLSARRDGAPLNAMACAARCLRDPAVIVPLFAASDPRGLYDALKLCKAQASITPAKVNRPADQHAGRLDNET